MMTRTSGGRLQYNTMTKDEATTAPERNVVRDRALKELWYAVIATGVTLVLAIAFYAYVPELHRMMQERDEGLQHTRIFQKEAAGGTIVYKLEGSTDTDFDAAIDRYILDLEILVARFERGQFAMVNLPGMAVSDEVAGMKRNKDAFAYTIVKDPDSPRIEITARSPAAREALHAYLDYLSTRWKF